MNDFKDGKFRMIFKSGEEGGNYDDWANGRFRTAPFEIDMILSHGDQYLVSLDRLSMDFFPANITKDHFFTYNNPKQPSIKTFYLVDGPTFVDSPTNLVELIKASIPLALINKFTIDFDVSKNRIVINVVDTEYYVHASLPLTLMLGFFGDAIFQKGESGIGVRPPNLFRAFETIFIECPTLCENIMIGAKSRPLLATLLPDISKTQQESFHINVSFASKRWVPIIQNAISSLEVRFTDLNRLPIRFVNQLTGPCMVELVFKKRNILFF